MPTVLYLKNPNLDGSRGQLQDARRTVSVHKARNDLKGGQTRVPLSSYQENHS